MSNKKSLVEEAIIQMKNLEETVAQNAKGILASTMKKEIKDLVKESIVSEEDDEEIDTNVKMDMDTDSDEDDVEMDMDVDSDEDDMDMDEPIDLTKHSDEEVSISFGLQDRVWQRRRLRGSANHARAAQPVGRVRGHQEHQGHHGHQPHRHPRLGSAEARTHRSQDRVPAAERGSQVGHPQDPLEEDEPDERHQPEEDRRDDAGIIRS